MPLMRYCGPNFSQVDVKSLFSIIESNYYSPQSQDMLKINGDANALAVKTAAAGGVDRFVYVSAIQSTLPSFVLKG